MDQDSRQNQKQGGHEGKEQAHALGRAGEDYAAEYLRSKGYKILDRNYRKPWGEVDIIARAPDKTLVFMEVKTMVSYNDNERGYGNGHGHGAGLKPEDQLTQAKLDKLQKTAQLYTGHYPERVDDKKGWRIDLLAITLRRGSGQALGDASGQDDEPKVVQYENI